LDALQYNIFIGNLLNCPENNINAKKKKKILMVHKIGLGFLIL